MGWFKGIVKIFLAVFFRVEVKGLEHYRSSPPSSLIIANHNSHLDALLLAVFLPDSPIIVLDTRQPVTRYVKLLKCFARVISVCPTDIQSVEPAIKQLNAQHRVVIFPEGRISTTGNIMKIYSLFSKCASQATAIIPIHINGLQNSSYAIAGNPGKLTKFPKITLRILPLFKIASSSYGYNEIRAARDVNEIMTQLCFESQNYHQSLWHALLDARQALGGSKAIIADQERGEVTYDGLITKSLILGEVIAQKTRTGEAVGIMLPSTTVAVITFFAMQAVGRVAAMINFTSGVKAMRAACHAAKINTLITSRRFIEKAELRNDLQQLTGIQIIFLEDLKDVISIKVKLKGLIAAKIPALARRYGKFKTSQDPAVVLFTSGSEGAPKGVVLSHANILANRYQLAARIDFTAQDIILNALPLFHSFGLTAGTILPVLSGMKTFFYPSPLHYKVIPELAYQINATMLFGTNTFLAKYGREADPYDFYRVRYVFAGAEKLQEEVCKLWHLKFGLRIFEGYGATETSPVLATNTAKEYRFGSVGRLLPGMEYHIEPVPGLEECGRLYVKGPNVMRGYLLSDNPGLLVPPRTHLGLYWYDTGDIVSVDDDGYIYIRGRAKRFAKISGEMISLTAVESMALSVWPEAVVAVVAIADEHRGEQLVLVTDNHQAERAELLKQARVQGISEISVPKKIIIAPVPLLSTGKIDYMGAQALVNEALRSAQSSEASTDLPEKKRVARH